MLKFLNTQLDPQATKQDATKLISQGAQIGWVTCDVDYSTPAIQAFLQAKLLTVSPCIGTDQMGPSRFGSAGDLAFSFGNAAQDEGSAMAEWAYAHGWKSADVVTDKLLVYFQNVCTAFTNRFKQLGGTIVDSESFTQGDKTINNVATRINGKKADMIAFCTSFAGDQPAFVSGLRTLGNKTPIMNSWAGDGAYWWSKNPKVTNYYFVTYAGAVAKDPDPAVRAFEAQDGQAREEVCRLRPAGFITGADAIDAIAYAIKKNGGSTDGAKLAAALSHLFKFKTLGGPITFTPVVPQRHRAALPDRRGQQQRGQGGRRAHHEGRRQHPLSELAARAAGSGLARRCEGPARSLRADRRLALVRGDPRAPGRRPRAGARRGARA